MKKFTCMLVGILMVASASVGCGKKAENVINVKNEGSTQITQTQNSNTIKQESTTKEADILLGDEFEIFTGFESKIPKGYKMTAGSGGKVVFNSDKADIYISRSFGRKKQMPLSEMTSESIAENISNILWIDDGIAMHIDAYTKDVPVSINSVNDTEINGIKMKKFEGKLTLAKSSSDKDTTWDCYIYGYVFEEQTNTIVYFGLEQEQSQTADKIELIKKNMDAIVNTISLF